MIKGGLFTRYFLEEGIRETEAYKAVATPEVENFTQDARVHWRHLSSMTSVNERETVAELIDPILKHLGWSLLPEQKTARDARDVPDALLFLTEALKDQARQLPTANRFTLGAVVVEYEARDTKLDRASASHEAPSSQILRYMSRADIASNGTLRWGLLTNGRFWRLYDHRALARAEGFIEFDLESLISEDLLLVPANEHWLRVFLLLFRVGGYEPLGVTAANFLQLALAEGRKYEQRITAALSAIVFNDVFPGLVTAIGAQAASAQTADPVWRAAARQASLKLLFRLLFLLYAEDRQLLPVSHDGYKPYSLHALREEAARIADEQRTLSPRAATWWPRLRNLFAAIAAGDDSMGLPPYNGGLFDEAGDVEEATLPDAVLTSLIEKMSREGPAGNRRWINYRDLSVQQLGSIYERLLEQDVVEGPTGGLTLRPNAFSRKTTGSLLHSGRAGAADPAPRHQPVVAGAAGRIRRQSRTTCQG